MICGATRHCGAQPRSDKAALTFLPHRHPTSRPLRSFHAAPWPQVCTRGASLPHRTRDPEHFSLPCQIEPFTARRGRPPSRCFTHRPRLFARGRKALRAFAHSLPLLCTHIVSDSPLHASVYTSRPPIYMYTSLLRALRNAVQRSTTCPKNHLKYL